MRQWQVQRLQQIPAIVYRAEEPKMKIEKVPTIISVETRFPIFEAIIGPGLVHECIAWKGGREQFYIMWRFRRDRRVNEALLRLYPGRAFAADMVVMRLGSRGLIVGFNQPKIKRQARLAVLS